AKAAAVRTRAIFMSFLPYETVPALTIHPSAAQAKGPPDTCARAAPDCENCVTPQPLLGSERPTAVAADVDALRREGTVRLLVRRLDGKRGAGLDIALVADFIT